MDQFIMHADIILIGIIVILQEGVRLNFNILNQNKEENMKVDENLMVPDIRPENIETITETYTPSGGG